jgi:hypothetical protein
VHRESFGEREFWEVNTGENDEEILENFLKYNLTNSVKFSFFKISKNRELRTTEISL